MQWADRQHGLMALALLDRIDWMETEYVELQMAGEPTLHPRLLDIVAKVKSKGIMVGFSTNGHSRSFSYHLVDILTVTKDRERDFGLDPAQRKNVFTQELGVDHPYEDVSHEKKLNIPARLNCTTPWTHISIHWDGDVVPCCKCFGKQHVFGNLYDMTMKQILNSHKRKEFLRGMHTGKNYICSYCQIPNPHKIHERLIREKKNRLPSY
jgi:radical SAM protein with 4Fe4S-binding SPASM domain